MADERRPHPAPLPIDADPSEARLAEAWRALEADGDEGPSELADARILRAAREALAEDAIANAPARAERRQLSRWSAAAALVLSIGAGLLVWREVPDGPEALVGAESRQAAAAPAAPPPAAKRSGAEAERRVAEEIAITARREAVPVAAMAAPARAASGFADEAIADAESAGQDAANAAPSPEELEGRLRTREGRWYLDVNEAPLALDLSELTETRRSTLEEDTRVRLRVLPGADGLRVLELEILPD